MNSQVKKIHFSKKMAKKTGIRHIAKKSADIIDPVQKQKFRKTKKTNKSKIQKSENEEIGKSKYKSTKFAKRLHNTSCIFAALSQLQTCTPVSKRNR
jgi:hypothetical protein